MAKNMMALGASWFDEQRKAHMSDWVSYRRGDLTHPVLATASRSMFEVMDGSGVVERWESRDFVISAGDLPFDPPERGDLVIETVGTKVLTYQVLAPKGSEVWKWDPFRTAMTVHTKLVGEV
ncbi:MAG: hypothetical protein WCJ31_15145 [Planctomycetia bacterium]